MIIHVLNEIGGILLVVKINSLLSGFMSINVLQNDF